MLYYFAYGSNLLSRRLAARTPSARPLGIARLPGHRLYWHKRGRDGSGKCDAALTGDRGDAVVGVVYRLDAGERAALDRAEGLGAGYHGAEHDFVVAGRALSAFFYRADAGAVDPALAPFDWYHALVVAGAREHRLPADYIAALQRATVDDPDAERRRAHFALLAPP